MPRTLRDIYHAEVRSPKGKRIGRGDRRAVRPRAPGRRGLPHGAPALPLAVRPGGPTPRGGPRDSRPKWHRRHGRERRRGTRGPPPGSASTGTRPSSGRTCRRERLRAPGWGSCATHVSTPRPVRSRCSLSEVERPRTLRWACAKSRAELVTGYRDGAIVVDDRVAGAETTGGAAAVAGRSAAVAKVQVEKAAKTATPTVRHAKVDFDSGPVLASREAGSVV